MMSNFKPKQINYLNEIKKMWNQYLKSIAWIENKYNESTQEELENYINEMELKVTNVGNFLYSKLNREEKEEFMKL